MAYDDKSCLHENSTTHTHESFLTVVGLMKNTSNTMIDLPSDETHLIESETQVNVNELGRFEIDKNVERVPVAQAQRESHDTAGCNTACVSQTTLKPLRCIPIILSEEVSV